MAPTNRMCLQQEEGQESQEEGQESQPEVEEAQPEVEEVEEDAAVPSPMSVCPTVSCSI